MFLHDEVAVDDVVDVRGPIGGWFVWRGDTPALLIGGGSGIVPVMAMLRLARRLEHPPGVHLLVSVRSPDDLYYSDELPGPDTTVVYTRKSPADSRRPTGRISRDDVDPLVEPLATAYICGSAPFCDAATEIIIDSGIESEHIRIERFGPSG